MIDRFHMNDDDAPDDGDGELPAEPFKEGRIDQISRLFHEHNEALVRFLVLRLHSQQEAKEVAQEAYVRLLSLHRPGAVSFLKAFLFKTAANIATDRMRSRCREQRAAQTGLFDDLREAHTPERETAGMQDVRLLQQLIAELPPKCRHAFLLQRIYGAQFPDIAAQMGISERMVRKYVTRALTYCRAGLNAAANANVTTDTSQDHAADPAVKPPAHRREDSDNE